MHAKISREEKKLANGKVLLTYKRGETRFLRTSWDKVGDTRAVSCGERGGGGG